MQEIFVKARLSEIADKGICPEGEISLVCGLSKSLGNWQWLVEVTRGQKTHAGSSVL